MPGAASTALLKENAMPTLEKEKKKTISITEKLPKELLDKEGFMDLDATYEQAVTELGLQQSKRDQIIAFYLALLGLIVPSVISEEMPGLTIAMICLGLYVIGVLFCHVILRYRVYKECYWIACRVITQLHHIKKENRTDDVIKTLYFHALEKNRKSTVISREDKKKKPVASGEAFEPHPKPHYLPTMRRQIDSAETLLFETLVIFSTLAGGIGAYYLWQENMWIGIVLTVILVVLVVVMNNEYIGRLMKIYACVSEPDPEKREKKLDSAFGKAWMLHCSVDDLLEE